MISPFSENESQTLHNVHTKPSETPWPPCISWLHLFSCPPPHLIVLQAQWPSFRLPLEPTKLASAFESLAFSLYTESSSLWPLHDSLLHWLQVLAQKTIWIKLPWNRMFKKLDYPHHLCDPLLTPLLYSVVLINNWDTIYSIWQMSTLFSLNGSFIKNIIFLLFIVLAIISKI